MNSTHLQTLSGAGVYLAVVCLAGFLTHFVFKTTVTILYPSVSMFVLYVLCVLTAPLTRGTNPSITYAGVSFLSVLVFACSTMASLKSGQPRSPFLWSLIFQIPFCINLYYYGGIIFTHKFE